MWWADSPDTRVVSVGIGPLGGNWFHGCGGWLPLLKQITQPTPTRNLDTNVCYVRTKKREQNSDHNGVALFMTQSVFFGKQVDTVQ